MEMNMFTFPKKINNENAFNSFFRFYFLLPLFPRKLLNSGSWQNRSLPRNRPAERVAGRRSGIGSEN
jgi:hypothetical protein